MAGKKSMARMWGLAASNGEARVMDHWILREDEERVWPLQPWWWFGGAKAETFDGLRRDWGGAWEKAPERKKKR